MYGKKKSDLFLAKNTGKDIYVYESNMNFLKYIPGVRATVRDLGLSDKTVTKYLDSNKVIKGYYLFSFKQ